MFDTLIGKNTSIHVHIGNGCLHIKMFFLFWIIPVEMSNTHIYVRLSGCLVV